MVALKLKGLLLLPLNEKKFRRNISTLSSSCAPEMDTQTIPGLSEILLRTIKTTEIPRSLALPLTSRCGYFYFLKCSVYVEIIHLLVNMYQSY